MAFPLEDPWHRPDIFHQHLSNLTFTGTGTGWVSSGRGETLQAAGRTVPTAAVAGTEPKPDTWRPWHCSSAEGSERPNTARRCVCAGRRKRSRRNRPNCAAGPPPATRRPGRQMPGTRTSWRRSRRATLREACRSGRGLWEGRWVGVSGIRPLRDRGTTSLIAAPVEGIKSRKRYKLFFLKTETTVHLSKYSKLLWKVFSVFVINKDFCLIWENILFGIVNGKKQHLQKN